MHLVKKHIFYLYVLRSLNHASVVGLRHHRTARVCLAADYRSFLFLVFTFSGSFRVQQALQYVFAFAGWQIVEEVQWCHLNEPKRTETEKMKNEIECGQYSKQINFHEE